LIRAVIGAGYGDEGKGLMTDYYASKSKNCLVVRHNGAGQAGHTVVTPDGLRHTFSHFGSGTFAGADTFLSRFTAFHPQDLLIEYLELAKKMPKGKLVPNLFVDPNAIVITPFDRLLNQLVEEKRGKNRHGSCGYGLNEAVTRHEAGYPTKAGDLLDLNYLRTQLNHIVEGWLIQRAEDLGIELPALNFNIFIDTFLAQCARVRGIFYFISPSLLKDVIKKYDDIIFEGAQGLMLDQDMGHFPHVTRSNTGIKNAVTLCKEWGLNELDVTYVTRAYVTRHGNGPLAHELPSRPEWLLGEETTNKTNQFQGHFRYAPVDLDILINAIWHDEGLAGNILDRQFKYDSGLAITCMDQLSHEHKIPIMVDDQELHFNLDLFDQYFDSVITSYGPTRNNVNDDTGMVPPGSENIPGLDAPYLNDYEF
jgi:adenylosuccinate synthase